MIAREDLKIEVWPYDDRRGGQHAGTSPGVKVTHLPTGTVAVSSLARSQHKNRQIALDMLVQALTHPWAK